MAPAYTTEKELSLEQIVFSCNICQAIPSEVYAIRENDKGFNHEPGDKHGTVTKMWIASCSHITCAVHLEGGAAPFHPKDVPPRAKCPKCCERGDSALKDLFAIRGVERDELDSRIPDAWIQFPPAQLDESSAGMEAMRFQYTALANHARRARERWRRAEKEQKALEREVAHKREKTKNLEAAISDLQATIKPLEAKATQLAKWEKRKPLINHYLGIVSKMANDIGEMRATILQLGYLPPECKYAYEPSGEIESTTKNGNPPVQRSIAEQPSVEESLSKKRKWNDVPSSAAGSRSDGRRPSSRDLMPPPLTKRRAPDQSLRTNPHFRRASESMNMLVNSTPVSSRENGRSHHRDNPVYEEGLAYHPHLPPQTPGRGLQSLGLTPEPSGFQPYSHSPISHLLQREAGKPPSRNGFPTISSIYQNNAPGQQPPNSALLQPYIIRDERDHPDHKPNHQFHGSTRPSTESTFRGSYQNQPPSGFPHQSINDDHSSQSGHPPIRQPSAVRSTRHRIQTPSFQKQGQANFASISSPFFDGTKSVAVGNGESHVLDGFRGVQAGGTIRYNAVASRQQPVTAGQRLPFQHVPQTAHEARFHSNFFDVDSARCNVEEDMNRTRKQNRRDERLSVPSTPRNSQGLFQRPSRTPLATPYGSLNYTQYGEEERRLTLRPTRTSTGLSNSVMNRTAGGDRSRTNRVALEAGRPFLYSVNNHNTYSPQEAPFSVRR